MTEIAPFGLSRIAPLALVPIADRVVRFTAPLNDVVGSTAVDAFMDQAAGLGHRVAFGHSPEYLWLVAQSYGLAGVMDAIPHWARDLMSPHGVPILPFTQEIGRALGLTPMQMVNWMSLNIGDLIACLGAVVHSTYFAKDLLALIAGGGLNRSFLVEGMVGATLKIVTSLVAPNPIVFMAGLSDLAFLGYGASHLMNLGPSSMNTSLVDRALPLSEGALLGSIGAPLTMAICRKNEFSWAKIGREAVAGAFGGALAALVGTVSQNAAIIGTAAISGYILAKETFSLEGNVSTHDLEDVQDLVPIDIYS